MILRWVTPSGERKRISKTTKLPIKGNKKRAEEMLFDSIQEKQGQLNNMNFGSHMFFADFIEFHWLPEIKNRVRITTYGGYQGNVEKRIAPFFRDLGVSLNNLSADHIREYYQYLTEFLGLKGITVNKHHSNIKQALDFAVKQKLVKFNVIHDVEPPPKKRFPAKYYRESEVIELFEKAQGHDLELPIILAAFYGLRRAEVVGLRWESINFETNTITIEHTITSVVVDGHRVEVVEDTTKSNSGLRSLPLIPIFRKKLEEVWEEQQRNRKLFGRAYERKDKDYILVDKLGKRIKPESITRRFPDFLIKNKMRIIRFHDLRHTSASLLIANKVPLIDIMEWLGHSDIGITANTYGHLEFESKIDSANAMTWIHDTSLADAYRNSETKQDERNPAPVL